MVNPGGFFVQNVKKCLFMIKECTIFADNLCKKTAASRWRQNQIEGKQMSEGPLQSTETPSGSRDD